MLRHGVKFVLGTVRGYGMIQLFQKFIKVWSIVVFDIDGHGQSPTFCSVNVGLLICSIASVSYLIQKKSVKPQFALIWNAIN